MEFAGPSLVVLDFPSNTAESVSNTLAPSGIMNNQNDREADGRA